MGAPDWSDWFDWTDPDYLQAWIDAYPGCPDVGPTHTPPVDGWIAPGLDAFDWLTGHGTPLAGDGAAALGWPQPWTHEGRLARLDPGRH